jgi:hypothetical protein
MNNNPTTPKHTNKRKDNDIENASPATTTSSMSLRSGKPLQPLYQRTSKHNNNSNNISRRKVSSTPQPFSQPVIQTPTSQNIIPPATFPSTYGTYDEILENVDTGSNNAQFTTANLKVLFDAITIYLPTGKALWDSVAEYYNRIFKSNPRKVQNLRKKFNHLANHPMSLEDDNMLPEMRRAKNLMAQIVEKRQMITKGNTTVANAVVNDDQNDIEEDLNQKIATNTTIDDKVLEGIGLMNKSTNKRVKKSSDVLDDPLLRYTQIQDGLNRARDEEMLRYERRINKAEHKQERKQK